MRSKTLEAVLGEFEKWRARRRGRSAIPEKLWCAAVDLVERYSSTTICRRLRLNPGRFKEVREARGVPSGERGLRWRRRAGSGGRRSGSGRRFSLGRHRVALVPAPKTFVELPSPNAPGGVGVFPPSVVMPRTTPGIRLTLESATGMLTVSTATADSVLADAVCQFVRSALGRSAGA
jgi:hypothetical protein